MKKLTGIILLILAALLCVSAAASEPEAVADAFGEFRSETLTEGFTVPVPADTAKFQTEQKSSHYLICKSTDGNAPNSLYFDAYVFDPLGEFAEQKKAAEAAYDSQRYDSNKEYREETVNIDGHIARLCVFRGEADTGDYSIGILRYVRNNRMLQIRVYSEPQNGTGWEDLPKVSLEDIRKLAEQVQYDPSQASATAEDGRFELFIKEKNDVISAGKSVTVIASYLNEEKAKKSAGFMNSFRWSVENAETGKALKTVSIDKNGILTTNRKISSVLKVIVRAETSVFHTKAEISVTVIPAMNSLGLEPKRVTLYTGETEPAILSAVPNPKNVPPIGITWSASPKGIVKIEPDAENGTASVIPLKAGDTTITAQEPGGKLVRAAVTVMQAVENMELTVSGTAYPYNSVIVKEKLTPKNAGNKTVKWSLDVGRDIATISGGKVKIEGGAKPGTVITVTCTAEGAPEPIVRTVQIEVVSR